MSRVVSWVLAAAAVTSAACSLVIDSGQYVGQGPDGGGLDAPGLDAPGLDAPGPDASVDGPPVLVSVALDNYWPFVGETIRATAVGLADPGSAALPTVRYQWLLNDMPIVDATTNTLNTSTLSADAELTLQAYAEDLDTMRSETVTVGPIRLRPDVTAWRPLLPDVPRSQNSGWVWDPRHERVVMYTNGSTFEAVLDGSRVAVRPLDPDGDGPPAATRLLPAMLDPRLDRALFVDGDDPRNVFVLDLARRGGERWSLVSAGADVPSPRVLASQVYDPERNLFWVYGGFFDGAGAFSDLHTLSADGTTWTLQTVDGSLAAFAASTMVMDPTRADRFFILGGLDLAAGSPGATDAVQAVTITGSMVQAVRMTGLVEPRLASTAFARASDIVLLGGATDIATLAPHALRFDVSTGGSMAGAASTMPSVFGIIGARSGQPPVWWGGSTNLSGSAAPEASNLSIGVLDAEGATSSIGTLVRPPPLREAIGSADRDSARIFGGSAGGALSNEVWEIDLRTQRFSRVTTMSDALDGERPLGREGFVAEPTSLQGRLVVFGGRMGGAVVNGDAWSLIDDRWTRHTMMGGASAIMGRYGATALDPRCGSTQLVVFGGQRSDGRVVMEAAELACDSPDRRRECSWSVNTELSAPPERTFSAGFVTDNTVYLFGGRDGLAAPMGDLVAYRTCGLSSFMGPLSMTPPGPRWGHSITERGLDPTPFEAIMFGGRGPMEQDLDETYLLTVPMENQVAFQAITPLDVRPPPRTTHLAFWDEGQERLIVYGGDQNLQELGDLWELRVRRP